MVGLITGPDSRSADSTNNMKLKITGQEIAVRIVHDPAITGVKVSDEVKENIPALNAQRSGYLYICSGGVNFCA